MTEFKCHSSAISSECCSVKYLKARAAINFSRPFTTLRSQTSWYRCKLTVRISRKLPRIQKDQNQTLKYWCISLKKSFLSPSLRQICGPILTQFPCDNLSPQSFRSSSITVRPPDSSLIWTDNQIKSHSQNQK